MLYYKFCIELKRSEEEYLRSSVAKVMTVLLMHEQIQNNEYQFGEPEVINSMKDIPGFV
ncbi:hypothetical protein [Clostridium sp. UBA2485]|uniref:hypothetical protein n=1 Tax=Clostridium sp. UBA2485 TaxID=1946352 RepID=UPI0025C25E45|nr:hypothetical protein [Clostridium sp. UBA2485]